MPPDDFPLAAAIREAIDETPESPHLELIDARPPEYSDEALALMFSARHADELRYVAAWGRWYRWTGTHWAPDDTLAAFDLARAVCRSQAALLPATRRKLAAAIASARTVAAIASLARADRRHAATVDQWDCSDDTLNTPAGTLELCTGAMRPHRREDYCTKATAVAPEGACPLWLDTLRRIFNDDAALIAYLQRFAGYCLSGSTREHAMVFCHGTGRNGKSLVVNTLARMLGDYATTAPMETFCASHTEGHPTDLAGLRGARLVTAIETEQGRRWAESKIKALTGGDTISARFMRQDFFTFRPKFKLLIAGNHKPGLRGVDEAIRRRLHLLPFSVTIPAAEANPELPERLRAEWPGILAWAVEGHAEWRRIGLAPPAAVREATDRYLAAEDAIGQWLDEDCARDSNYAERSAVLFGDWKRWADAAGEFVGDKGRFNQAMENHGFRPFQDSRTRRAMFRGLTLRPDL